MERIDIPSGPSTLGPAWLTASLRSSGALPEGEVTGLDIEPFAEGVGLLGQLVRLRPSYEGAAPTAPKSLVAKFPSRSAESIALCEALRLYFREHHFYTSSVTDTPMNVPRPHASLMDGLTRFVLLLEDIDGVVPGDQIAGASADQIRIAVREVARHHARFWGRAREGSRSWLPAISDPTMVPVVRAITAAGARRVVEELPECFTEETRAVALRLSDAIPALSEALCRGPTTFVHGDFRIDNLLFGQGGARPELTVVDWQICYEARGPYDVGYIMTQSVEPAVRRSIEAEVLSAYHAALLQGGVRDYDRSTMEQDYRRASTYCLCYPLIAAGTLDLKSPRGRALGKMMLGRALSAVEDAGGTAVLDAL